MKYYLIVAAGKRRGLPIPIEIDLFVLGQDKTCQLRSSHPEVGGQHCAIVNRGRKVFIRDYASGFPTIVNGETLPTGEEWPLHAGDLLEVGPLSFRISFHEKHLSKKDLEEWALKTLDEDIGQRMSALDQIDQTMKAKVADHVIASEAANAMLNQLSAMKGVVRGRLRITLDGDVTIVRINDNVLVDDAELAHMKKELQDNLNRPNLRVLVDMKDVRRMSSTAFRVFADFAGWLQRQGSTLAFCRFRPDLAEAFTGLAGEGTFRIFPDKPQALRVRW